MGGTAETTRQARETEQLVSRLDELLGRTTDEVNALESAANRLTSPERPDDDSGACGETPVENRIR